MAREPCLHIQGRLLEVNSHDPFSTRLNSNISLFQVAMTSSKLLALPREVRDIILKKYVTMADGYVYSFSTNSLRHANGDRIDLSLASTCRQLGHEMRGLALRTNRIHFSTYCSEETQVPAETFHFANEQKLSTQYILTRELVSKLLTPTMARSVTQHYPILAPILETWSRPSNRVHGPQSSYGIAPSLWADFVLCMLEFLSSHPDFLTEASTIPGFTNFFIANKAMEVVHAPHDPWEIPSSKELDAVSGVFGGEPISFTDHIKYSYSAAALAIRFFKSITGQTRAQFRHVVLHEDYESIARPASHARGLIPFCKENHKLRIERPVKLWQTAMPIDKRSYSYYFMDDRWQDMRGPPIEEVRNDKLTSRTISRAVGEWIVEAHLLLSLGMPQESFTLVLDGEPTPEKSTTVFDIIQRDIAWQTALDISYKRGSLPTPSWADRRTQIGYMYEALPALIKDISQDSSLIRCNFDPGSPQDAEALAVAHGRWSLERWTNAWTSHEPQEFETDPPLPPWHELKWQRVLLGRRW